MSSTPSLPSPASGGGFRLVVGDEVRPKVEWRDRIPAGRVVKVVPFGSGTAVYVVGDHRAFVDYVFEKVR
jgi:hypothetical protein